MIVGTQGGKGLQRLVFGSVAEEVFLDVAYPVLTVGSEVKAPDPAGLKISKVLLAADCSPRSLAPIYAAWLCQRFGAGLFVLHVVGKEDELKVVTSSQVRERLVVLAPGIRELQPQPEFAVEWGEPSSKMLQVAGELVADLIVLGAHAPRDVRTTSRPPWATGAGVIAGAFCPVLTVRDTVSSSSI
jgi:nucleotide-binding universal stress UspA family protein